MTTTNQRAVEEVAKVLALVQNGHPDYTPQPTADAFWGLLDDGQRDRYRRMATAAAKLAPGWRPISEAPRDGTEVLLYVPRRRGAIISNASNPTGVQWWSRGCGELKPTHFMPLPPPPGEG